MQLNYSNDLTGELFNSLPVAIYTCDRQGHITSYNKAARALWGRKPELGKDLWCGSWKIFDLEGNPVSLDSCPMARTLKEGIAVEGEQIIVERPDHTKIKVKPYPVPLFNENGQLTGAVNTLIDVTDIWTNEYKRDVLAAIVNTSDDTIISKTLEGIITSWNAAAERMFGYTEEEIIGKHISILIPPSRLKEEDLIISRIASGKRVDHFETVRIAKDGTEIPLSLSISPIINSEGKITGASKIARDIRERKKAEEKQAILAAIVDGSEDTILSKTLQGNITSWNKSAEKMFGYTEEEILGKHISILIPPSRLSEEDFIISEVKKGKKVDHFETYRVAKDGRKIAISLTVSPIFDVNGNIIGASKIARDISLQIEAQEEARRSAERLQIINSMIQTISEELDLEKILQKVTDATTILTGAKFGAFFYNKADPEGESYMLYALSGAPREAFEKFGMPRNTAVFHATFSGEGTVRSDDITKDPRYGKAPPHFGMPEGHLPVVSYLAIPVISKSGAVIGGLFYGHPEAGVFTKEHEDIVISIASQAAIGLDNAKMYEEIKILNDKKDEFIGLASHELKTPLSTIGGYLQILERLKTDSKSQMFIEKTIRQVKKLASLVNDLLDVSKIEAGKLRLLKQKFDIRSVVENAVELIEHSTNQHKIILQTDVKGLIVEADPQRIEQVIINLLTNAIKYSPNADTVVVLLERDKNNVKIGVRDYGFGIAPEKFQNLFSRFYRVEGINPNISGLGIGLYLSHEIIERHQGKIWVESKIDKGSTFWFTIPVSDKHANGYPDFS